MKSLLLGALCCLPPSLAATGPGGHLGEPVVTLDFRGGHLARISDRPTLEIHSDGRVFMPRNYAHTKSYEGHLEPNELEALLDFILEESNFLDYDADRVASKLEKLPPDAFAPPLVHATTTEISVALPGQRKTVRYDDLGRGPLVEETERLLAVRHRLERIMSIVKLGGRAEALAWLDAANDQLAAEYPDVTPLTLELLKSGTIRDDGSVFVQFVRPAGRGEPGINVAISGAVDGDFDIGIVRNAK